MKHQITAIVGSVPHPATPVTVYHELDSSYYSATSKTFIGRVYSLLGLKNIADAADKTGSGYPKLSAEYIVAVGPAARRPRRHDLLRPDGGQAREAPRVVDHRGDQGRRRGRRQRRHRVAVGAAGRRLLARDRGGSEDGRRQVTTVPAGRVAGASAVRVSSPRRVLRSILGGAAFVVVRVSRRPARRARPHRDRRRRPLGRFARAVPERPLGSLEHGLGDPLAAASTARRARAARGRDARRRRRLVPRGLPEPARRPVPARRRRRSRARRDPGDHLRRRRDRLVRSAPARGVPRRGARRGALLCTRPLCGRGRAKPRGARARGRDGRRVSDGRADLHPAAARAVVAAGLQLDPRAARHRRLARRRARRPVHRRQLGRLAALRASPRRAQRGRRGGGLARNQREPDAADRRRVSQRSAARRRLRSAG